MFNESKGLIYIQEYDVTNFDTFKTGLEARYDIRDVIPATWITPKSSFSKPFLLTFNSSSPAPIIEVPGETENLKVYEYKQKRLFCTNCLEYTHSNREKIPWMLARQKYFMRRPDENKSHAEATRNKIVNDQLHTAA